jgi:hypothetical protein
MNLLQNLALLSTLTLPLSAQLPDHARPHDAPAVDADAGSGSKGDTRNEPLAAPQLAVALKVDHDARLATMSSNEQLPFFGFMIAATKPSTLDIPGIGGLLEFEAIVATALCKDGVMVLDLGKGGWGFDIYLQGAAMSEYGVALTSIEVVSDKAPEAK